MCSPCCFTTAGNSLNNAPPAMILLPLNNLGFPLPSDGPNTRISPWILTTGTSAVSNLYPALETTAQSCHPGVPRAAPYSNADHCPRVEHCYSLPQKSRPASTLGNPLPFAAGLTVRAGCLTSLSRRSRPSSEAYPRKITTPPAANSCLSATVAIRNQAILPATTLRIPYHPGAPVPPDNLFPTRPIGEAMKPQQ